MACFAVPAGLSSLLATHVAALQADPDACVQRGAQALASGLRGHRLEVPQPASLAAAVALEAAMQRALAEGPPTPLARRALRSGALLARRLRTMTLPWLRLRRP